ncbi:hypothetical protein [Streptomyces sp. Isolate_45]|uniref:hypothetical protein n=1 Tax=Streptomyces sp. Isolate_45 TaxID=2950111 RepID=UPI002481FAAD|nr:hypothetical protein [Streptomyces sp. Isolate_45]MDA5279547.1 hypothetical protein [Streptomyces sp. Isolate_45]
MRTPDHDALIETITVLSRDLATALGQLTDAPAPVQARARAVLSTNLATYAETVQDKYLEQDIVYAVGK